MAIKKFMQLCTGAVFGSMLLATPAVLAQTKLQDYVVDEAHTKVGFEIAHLVVSTVEGSFKKFDGTIKFDQKAFESGATDSFTLEANVDVATIDTGIKKRDDHLKSKDFFDAKKWPKMKFKSTKVESISGKKFKVSGDLTIRDKTKPVTFDMEFKGAVKAYDKNRVVFKGTTEINRKDFGLMWNDAVEVGPVVGDQVTINLVTEAILKKDM